MLSEGSLLLRCLQGTGMTLLPQGTTHNCILRQTTVLQRGVRLFAWIMLCSDKQSALVILRTPHRWYMSHRCTSYIIPRPPPLPPQLEGLSMISSSYFQIQGLPQSWRPLGSVWCYTIPPPARRWAGSSSTLDLLKRKSTLMIICRN